MRREISRYMYRVEFITDIRQLRLAESKAEFNETDFFLNTKYMVLIL